MWLTTNVQECRSREKQKVMLATREHLLVEELVEKMSADQPSTNNPPKMQKEREDGVFALTLLLLLQVLSSSTAASTTLLLAFIGRSSVLLSLTELATTTLV